jgi:hypothetical protein
MAMNIFDFPEVWFFHPLSIIPISNCVARNSRQLCWNFSPKLQALLFAQWMPVGQRRVDCLNQRPELRRFSKGQRPASFRPSSGRPARYQCPFQRFQA